MIELIIDYREHKLKKHLLSQTEFIMGTFNYESPHQLVDRLYILK